MSQISEIPASAYTPEMETLGALPDILTFDGEPVPVSRNPLTSGTRLLQLLPLPGTEFPVRYETSRMRGFVNPSPQISCIQMHVTKGRNARECLKLLLSMASSDLSGEDFLGSLGISLDDVDLTAVANTHASAHDIYARYKRGELTATQVARFTLLLLFASTFWSNRKEKFNPSILKSLENMAHLAEYDWPGAILSRMYDDMSDLSRGHCKLSGTYYFWETWAFEYFPYTRPELIHADLGLGLVPSAWRWYRSNLQTVQRKKLLRDLRAFFDTCTLAQVPVGLVNQMMELMLGMQQELTSALTHRAFDDQRRRRPRR
ncbi:hypothetical protein JCGZ_17124 [Jatropha curcas]|uniref:Aminotransferase-like plant mobile domain-containing protein n=1 Tax=Jatropha curcas TaxID=180498 RepID=A0A067KF20_JATCU|nr:hypothetical protein JCGZ_17124 [Jatropha curcas]